MNSKPSIPVTVVLAVRNEAANLPKCLSALSRFERVILVDSGSTDDTAQIAATFEAELLQFRYQGGYPKKRQWALQTINFQTKWVLLLDADEVVPEALADEILQAIQPGDAAVGFLVKKGFHFMGKRFRFGGFSHSAVLLFQTGKAKFEELIVEDATAALDMEVHERVIIDGVIGTLTTPLIHEDYKGLEAYISRHNFYSTWDAHVRSRFLTSGKWGEHSVNARFLGNSQERRRFLKGIAIRIPCEPILWFLYHYIIAGGILEGRRGLIACTMRSQYISQVRAKLYEISHNSRKP